MQLWASDGTEAGTAQFASINDPDDSGAITLEWSRNNAYFTVASTEGILASDGITTELIHSGNMVQLKIPGLTYSVSSEGWMYFLAMENPWRLYRTQGTASSTVAVLNSEEDQVYPNLAELNGMLYGFAENSNNQVELRQLDPVGGTTTIVRTFSAITNGSGSNQNFYGFRAVGNHLYSFGNEGDHSRQYWRSDGAGAGTVMITDFQPTMINGGPNPSSANMIDFQGHFVFTANSEVVGTELFAAQGAVGIPETAVPHDPISAWMDGSGTLVIQGAGQLGLVRVLDVTGREVARRDQVRSEHVRIALGQQSAGLYLIRSEYRGQTRQAKVMLD